MRGLGASFVVIACIVGAPVHPGPRAEPARPPAPPTPPPHPYRGAMMIGDGMAAAFTLGGGALVWHNRDCACEDMSGGLVVIGVMIYLSWGAFTHHDAGHTGRAVASVALRIAAPTAVGLVAHRLGADRPRSVLAAGGGMVAGMALDWTLARGPGRASSPVTAYAQPIAGGALAGVTGVW